MNKAELIPSANDLHLNQLLTEARTEERKDKALAVSIRLKALAIVITRKEMNHKDVAELLRQEAQRFEHESQDSH
ncbi:DUF2732 family protein [Pantoea sp. FN060301]|uniref:DUF2732 family protein n=1 Tax=Pantoea sp. FN060301 TaxID=3420380 RepID=UPI003D162E32